MRLPGLISGWGAKIFGRVPLILKPVIAGASVDTADDKGRTPLRVTCESGHFSTAQVRSTPRNQSQLSTILHRCILFFLMGDGYSSCWTRAQTPTPQTQGATRRTLRARDRYP
eukprot:1045571-Rhodomonas_salina.3